MRSKHGCACAQVPGPRSTPYRPIQLTVPETPSPEVLLQQQAAVVVGARGKGGPGRHVSDTTPSKGRLAKTQRLDDGASGEGRATAHASSAGCPPWTVRAS